MANEILLVVIMKMLTMKSVLISFFFFSLNVCAQPGNNYLLHNDTPGPQAMKLRTDGLYSTYDTSVMKSGVRKSDHYRIYAPIYILKGGNAIYLNAGGDKGTSLASITYFQNLKSFKNIVGTYTIENIKIKASLPIQLYVWGMRLKTFTAHFEGTIKNRDTILDWKMVPPYPKAPKKFNNDFKELLKPKLLYFIESNELSGLDSLYRQR